MILQIFLLLLGFVALIKSADWLVTGASSLAKKYNISDLAIGLTIVAFGTSAPELVVNIFAASQGHHEIVFGNIIGSNNFNLFLILGITGLILPISVKSTTVWKEIPLSLVAVVALFIITSSFLYASNATVTRWEGLVLLGFFAFFLYYVYSQLRVNNDEIEEIHVVKMSNLKIWLFIIIGLSGLVIGGRLVVVNAVKMAEALGVSQKIIGLTIVAIGTSLPELATSIVAALKKNSDIVVGNVIGSNIFNIFLVLGVSSLINPLQYSAVFNPDMILLALGTLFLFVAMFTGGKRKLDRWEAAILVAIIGFYMTYTVMLEL